ncbi:hypothetical protein FNU79_01875 [Deinococcus detaillensis]|uniref:DUF2268 domain-containing protein n=2 Tax=Deinococcus detaillensis TaxID=2592048 RepID=A0A553V6R0_9DEIO|nr:hypothetical protein FNU79_01875 [Deinococcus detaillensis]
MTAELIRLAALLSLEGVDVALFVDPAWCIPELGLGGYAPTGYRLQLTIDPENSHFIASWRRELPVALAHELHHLRRWRGPGYGQTLREALASEGLAQHFEAAQRGELPIYAQPSGDLAALWERARPLLDAPTYNHNAWFYGSEAEQLPRWAGYQLGYEQVKRGLERLGGDAVSHAETPAAVLIDDR